MSKVKTQLEDFLIAIDGLDEGTIRDIMGKNYIDTPGFYSSEAENYESIFDFFHSNLGSQGFDELIEFHDTNPETVEQIITTYNKRHA